MKHKNGIKANTKSIDFKEAYHFFLAVEIKLHFYLNQYSRLPVYLGFILSFTNFRFLGCFFCMILPLFHIYNRNFWV